jgi:AcrR family transcriptional regulator
MQVPEIARRAGVHSTTIYRRWGSRSRLVGEALLERGRPLSPTPLQPRRSSRGRRLRCANRETVERQPLARRKLAEAPRATR